MSNACLDDELIALLMEGRVSAEESDTVRTHLASCSRCADVVAESIREEDGAPGTFEELGIRGRHHGDIVDGRWRLLHWLGAGGMGSVWEAEDVSGALGRCAVKLIATDGSDRSRLRREARLLAELNHPNIVRAYELFETETEAALVLELLRGESLAVHLARGPIAFEAAIGILRAIARGLVATHDRGVVHRDLKPSNVFVSVTGPRIRLLDLGLAAPTDIWKGATLTNLTGPTGSVGTPLYMAPERLFNEPLSERSPEVDLWALGLLAHEMIAGTLPFQAGPLGKLLRAVTQAPFDALSHRAKVPPALDAMVSRWLSFAPSERGDAHVALDDLERLARALGVEDTW